MCCFLTVLLLIGPRAALVYLWLFTDMVGRAFDSFLLPLLGLIFLPFTTLMYAIAYRPLTGVSGFGWLLVIVGFLIDLGAHGGGAYRHRDRFRRQAY